MKKFDEYRQIREELAGALVEPKSQASAEAKKLNLVYVGFGRYEDPKTQQVTHIVQNGKLVPFSKATKTNSFAKTSGDDFGDYAKNMMPDIEQSHGELSSAYPPEMYDDNELNAIENYSATSYYEINDRLRNLPSGIAADQIEPMYAGDPLPGQVAALDSALKKSKAPKDFIAYASLAPGYSIDSFKPGQNYKFKGFRSLSIDPNVALNYASNTPQASRTTSFALQIHVRKGTNGMYLDDFSPQAGEAEYLLPRGAQVKIVSGPHKMVGSNKRTNNLNQEVYLYVAEVINSKGKGG